MDKMQDAYCGLYCAACEILLASRRSGETGILPAWKDLPAAYHVFPDEAEIRCEGCRSDDVFIGCRGCKLRSCAREKGVDYCFECPEYPCAITEELKKSVDQAKTQLPHAEGIINNLTQIQAMWKDAWLEEQNKLHSCPICGKASGWYYRVCPECAGKQAR